MAQRQRRDWRDSTIIIAHFWQIAPVSERQSRCPLEPVLGCFFEENISIYNLFVFAANTKYLSRSVLLSQLSLE
jgi:hypothetical protein